MQSDHEGVNWGSGGSLPGGDDLTKVLKDECRV